MSFAQRFALGQQIAQSAIDAFEKGRKKKEINAIQDATANPQEGLAFTTEDEAGLSALANAKDPMTGKAYYTLKTNQDGSRGVVPNFDSQNDVTGQALPAGGLVETLRPRSNVVEFLGKRYGANELDDQMMDRLRNRAMADVITKYDPDKGFGLRMQLNAEDRAQKAEGRAADTHQWNVDDRPVRQQLLRQQVDKGAYDERQWSRNEKVQSIRDDVAKMSEEQLQLYAQKLNTNGSDLPFLYVGKNKSGYQFTTIDPSTGEVLGKQHSLSAADLRQMATASALGMAGFGDESMTLLRQANKDIADQIDRYNRVTSSVVSSQNSALSSGNQDTRADAQLKLSQKADVRAERGLQLQEEANTRANKTADLAANPFKANIESAQRLLGRQLTSDEVERMVGLAKENALTLKEVDGQGVYVDSRGNPTAKYDPALGMVPFGTPDPRTDKKLVENLDRAGVAVTTVQTKNGVVWGYEAKDGRIFQTPAEAMDPPPNQKGVDELQGLQMYLKQEQAKLVAAGRSGDPIAISKQAQVVQGLQRTLTAAAKEKFGPQADKYLQGNN